MDSINILTIAGISTATSTLVYFIVHYLLKSSIDLNYKKKFESYKNDIDLKFEKELLKFKRQAEIYPKIAELIYRIRNNARDLSTKIEFKNSSLLDEMQFNFNQFKELLYQNRIELENNNLFRDIHSYKGLIETYKFRLDDLIYFYEHNENERVENKRQELQASYNQIDIYHLDLINKIKSYDSGTNYSS